MVSLGQHLRGSGGTGEGMGRGWGPFLGFEMGGLLRLRLGMAEVIGDMGGWVRWIGQKGGLAGSGGGRSWLGTLR